MQTMENLSDQSNELIEFTPETDKRSNGSVMTMIVLTDQVNEGEYDAERITKLSDYNDITLEISNSN